MKDNTAGHIAQEEADALIADLERSLGDDGCEFHSGVTYRHLMLLDGGAELKLRCAPPHDIIGQPVSAHAPTGTGADRVEAITRKASVLIAGHPVNLRRREAGKDPVTGIWLWGQGRPAPFESFASRFGPQGAVITGVDILRGMATLMGMSRIEVPGATGYIDTNYAGKGAAAVKALDEFDLIVVHVEAADEAAHMGSPEEKIKALERIDAMVVGPVMERLRAFPDWRVLVAADHPTTCATRGHSAVPPPFCYAGTGIPPNGGTRYTEAAAERTGLWADPGHTLMESFCRR
jgi:2,3-bisphosphoglycerate-independent phosphoglycerate mutase